MMERTFTDIEWSLRDDGRTVDGRIVPYGEVIEAYEHTATGIAKIKETFDRGSCTWEAQNARRKGNASWIEFRLEHGTEFDGLIGYARSLESKDDGAYASFRLYESADLPKVQSMLRESHNGLSVFFADRVEPTVVDGITHRRQVVLGHVAATPVPAYKGAQIMAMREAMAPEEALAMVGGTPHLDEIKQLLATLKGTQHE